MGASDEMPLPDDIRAAATNMADDFDQVARTISSTQVAAYQTSDVPGWIGDAADAYTESIRKLGVHARDLSQSFTPAVNAIRDWAAEVGVAIDTTVPALWERYEDAKRSYRTALDDLSAEESLRRGTPAEMDQSEYDRRAGRAAATRDDLIAETLSDYKKTMETLDDHAQNCANALRSAQQTIVDEEHCGSRTEVGANLFNDIPLVDGQAEWEYAQKIAPEAAKILSADPSTDEDVAEFLTRYGDLCNNPFFAQALSELVAPEQNGVSVDSLVDTRVEQWKAFGNSRYLKNGQPPTEDLPYLGGTYGDHYGYEYLATMLGNAAESNPNLALGTKFFDSPDSIAHDIVAFDHSHGDEISISGGYGNWGTSPTGGFGGTRRFSDPVESMLRLMDDPIVFSEDTSRGLLGEGSYLSGANAERYDAVQRFFTDSTTFNIDPAQEAPRIPPVTDSGPMNMTRYLTSYRGNTYYTGTMDLGNALGSALADASNADAPPPVNTPEYDHWLERTQRSATVAANFILGYQEGLNIPGDSYHGADGFGNSHAVLRHWAGDILSSHVDAMATSLSPNDELPEWPFRIDEPQEAGYELRLNSV